MQKIFLAIMAMMTIVFASCVKNEPSKDADESVLKGQLFLNEVNGTGGASQVDAEKYVELYNSTDKDINLKNYVLDYGGTETWRGRADDVVLAKGYKLIKGTKSTYPSMSTGLSCRNAGVNLTLFDNEGGVVDYYEKMEDLNGKPLEQMDHMRIPDGGKWYFVEISAQSPGETNLTDATDAAVKGEMAPMEKTLRIAEVKVSATKPTPEDDVTIVATVTDVDVITSVVLKWKKDNVDQTDITMTKKDNDYSATIPKQVNGTVVNWTVTASNDKGKTVSETGEITWKTPEADYTKLKLNEVSGVGNDPDKFYELINTGTVPINIEDCKIYYNNDPVLTAGDGSLTWTGCPDQVIDANALFGLIGKNTECSFTTGLTAERKIKITFRDPAGNLIDQFIRAQDTGDYATPDKDKSFSRIPDGTGPFYFTTPTPNVTNGTSTEGLLLVPQVQ